jgi:hypothetical protein
VIFISKINRFTIGVINTLIGSIQLIIIVPLRQMTEIDQTIIQEIEHEVKPKTWKDTLWTITKGFLKIAVSGLLLWYVFTKIPFDKVKFRLLHANYWWMAAGAVFYFGSKLF